VAYSASIDSSDLPLVSRTNRQTNTNETTAKNAYIPYARPRPCAASGGNVVDTRKLASHCAAAATDSAMARMRFGNISPRSTQTTGPHEKPKKTTKPFAATSASVAAPPVSVGCRQGASQVAVAATSMTGAVPNRYARRRSVTDMPADPSRSSGRRPNRSMQAMAIRVATMLMPPEITEILSESSSVNPTACHSMLE
jgi:hypothetical protein